VEEGASPSSSSSPIQQGKCFGLITKYLLTGALPVNGIVCGNPLPPITGTLVEAAGVSEDPFALLSNPKAKVEVDVDGGDVPDRK
jgi:hypothetical protein